MCDGKPVSCTFAHEMAFELGFCLSSVLGSLHRFSPSRVTSVSRSCHAHRTRDRAKAGQGSWWRSWKIVIFPPKPPCARPLDGASIVDMEPAGGASAGRIIVLAKYTITTDDVMRLAADACAVLVCVTRDETYLGSWRTRISGQSARVIDRETNITQSQCRRIAAELLARTYGGSGDESSLLPAQIDV